MSFRSEVRTASSATLWWFVGLVVLVLGLVLAVGLYQRFEVGLENQHTQNVRQTNQYVTSQQQHLATLYTAYRDLDAQAARYDADPANAATVSAMREQQAALVGEMRRTAVTLEPAQVPPDVAALLARSR